MSPAEDRIRLLAERLRRAEEARNRELRERLRRQDLQAALARQAREALLPLEGLTAAGRPLVLLAPGEHGLTVAAGEPGGVVPLASLRVAVSPPDDAATWYVRCERTRTHRTAADLEGALARLLDLVEPLTDPDR